MCRLLGVVSADPHTLADSLADVLGTFAELSREHNDGWGMAAWRDGELGTVRDTAPAHDSTAYLNALRTSTDAALLHLRMASPDLPVELRNTHPFRAGAVAFAHNGYFTPLTAVDELIDPELLANVAGGTDSERYFLRMLSRLRTQGPVNALALAAADIRDRATMGSLNCMLLDEHALYVYADENPESEVRKRRGPEFFRMRYQVTAGRVIVASSGIAPASDDAWRELPYRHVLEVRRSDLRVSTHFVREAGALAVP